MSFSAFKNLEVWQTSCDLVVSVYQLTKSFPSEEKFGLTNQMRRAAISIPSNIAEGYRRTTKADRYHFAMIAFGSASELETQLILAERLGYLSSEDSSSCNAKLQSTLRLLNRYSTFLKNI